MPRLAYSEVFGYKTKDNQFVAVTTANKQTLRDGKTVLFTLVNNKYQPVFKFWKTENGNVFSVFSLGDSPDYTVVYGYKDHNKEFVLVSNPAEKILKDGKKVLFTVSNGNYQSVYTFWKFSNGKVFSPAVFTKR
jgi:cold shock CspA family protein